MLIRIIMALVAALMLVQSVALYGLASANGLAYLLGIAFMVLLFVPKRAAFSALGSFFVATLLIWGAVIGFGLLGKQGNSPDRILAAYDMVLDTRMYKADVDIAMTQASGDLGIMTTDGQVPRMPREIAFRTDALGFRNNSSLQPDDTVLVGGAFVQGSGNTQTDTLAAVLGEEFGMAAYSLGAPGDLYAYATRIQAFANDHKGPVYLFLSEGEDFGHYSKTLRPVLHRYVRLMETTAMAKFCIMQLESLRAADSASAVSTLPLENIRIAFSQANISETRKPRCAAGEVFPVLIASLKDSVDGIFFIPAKYRVYAPLLETADASTLPSADWDYLKAACDAAKIPCYNLTDPLQAEARNTWEKSRDLLWWPDDTHWNRNGVTVAAHTIAALQKPEEFGQPLNNGQNNGQNDVQGAVQNVSQNATQNAAQNAPQNMMDTDVRNAGGVTNSPTSPSGSQGAQAEQDTRAAAGAQNPEAAKAAQ